MKARSPTSASIHWRTLAHARTYTRTCAPAHACTLARALQRLYMRADALAAVARPQRTHAPLSQSP
eukprot:3850654-Pleurochrysis_carterae.AAC.2